jgi:hypothetical protein
MQDPGLYRPFRLAGEAAEGDWVKELELDDAIAFGQAQGGPPAKILILYGSLRTVSYRCGARLHAVAREAERPMARAGGG